MFCFPFIKRFILFTQLHSFSIYVRVKQMAAPQITPEQQEDIQRFNQLVQQLEVIRMNLQQLELEKRDVDIAMKETSTSSEIYLIMWTLTARMSGRERRYLTSMRTNGPKPLPASHLTILVTPDNYGEIRSTGGMY